MEHGNSNENKADHHLYEIRDKIDNDVVKYGISGDPLNPDGSSQRAEEQVDLFNSAVNWLRFYANVLITKIKGRIKAKEIETEHIEAYKLKNGKNPRANKDKKKPD